MEVIAYSRLSGEVRDRLLHLRPQGGPAPNIFFRLDDHRSHLWISLLVVGAIAAWLSSITFQERLFLTPAQATLVGAAAAIVAALAAVHCLVTLVEILRRQGSRLRPFTLITPIEIITADYDHGMIVRRRLSDATDFKLAREFDSGSGLRYSGTRYNFLFGWDQVSLLVRDSTLQQALDAVLDEARGLAGDEQARAAARTRYQLLPDGLGDTIRQRPLIVPNRPLSRPFSGTWGIGWPRRPPFW